MKRIALLIVAAVALIGCSKDDTGKPSTADRSGGVEWFTTTDPETGTTLRCAWRYNDGGYDGGAAMWCIEGTR